MLSWVRTPLRRCGSRCPAGSRFEPRRGTRTCTREPRTWVSTRVLRSGRRGHRGRGTSEGHLQDGRRRRAALEEPADEPGPMGIFNLVDRPLRPRRTACADASEGLSSGDPDDIESLRGAQASAGSMALPTDLVSNSYAHIRERPAALCICLSRRSGSGGDLPSRRDEIGGERAYSTSSWHRHTAAHFSMCAYRHGATEPVVTIEFGAGAGRIGNAGADRVSRIAVVAGPK